MNTAERLILINQMIHHAHLLAADDHVMVRVSGERIAVILADLLYEIDTGLDEVFSLLPVQRRDCI
jgi:hypothetical protein